MQKIVVVGPPGSGKSTLAKKIAQELGLGLFERDAHGSLGSSEYVDAVSDVLRQDRWVFDGFPYFVDDAVYSASDCVVALRYSRLLVLRQVVQRSWQLRKASSGGHAQLGLRGWARRDHAVRTAFTRYGDRIQEIDHLASRSELKNKPVLILRTHAEAERIVDRLSSNSSKWESQP